MNYKIAIDFLFLVPLTVVGIICLYTDIKYGKIFNKWVAWSFLYIFFLYACLFFYILGWGDAKDLYYSILMPLVNGLIAFLGGYLLWHFKFWSAADAKLFAIYAFLIPLHFYSKSYVEFFPSINLLVNLFIPLLLALTVKALFNLPIKNGGIFSVKNILNTILFALKIFLNYIFLLFAIQLTIAPMERILPVKISSNQFLNLAVLLIIGKYLQIIIKKIKWFNFVIYGVVLFYGGFLIATDKALLLTNIFKNALIFLILISLIRRLLHFDIRRQESENIGNSQKRAIPIGWLPFAPFMFLSAAISVASQIWLLPHLIRGLAWLRNVL